MTRVQEAALSACLEGELATCFVCYFVQSTELYHALLIRLVRKKKSNGACLMIFRSNLGQERMFWSKLKLAPAKLLLFWYMILPVCCFELIHCGLGSLFRFSC